MRCLSMLIAMLAGCKAHEPASKAPASQVIEDDARPSHRDRAAFAQALAKLQPGDSSARVIATLGEPDDKRTIYDPGGITAARTVEIWRYGTNGHLTFPTLGSVHMQADGTVQYVFGGKGTAIDATVLPEDELRALLRTVDRVPSYNAGHKFNPLLLVRAVNSLQPLGKDTALAVLAEYLRVSSWLDDPGREGVFLILRTLFDVPVPPGHMPVMMVGAPSPPAPSNANAFPRFPLVVQDDIPWLVVSGYAIGGLPEQPDSHLKQFAKFGVIRSEPLRPTNNPVASLDALLRGSFPQAIGFGHSNQRAVVMNQALAMVDSVYRVKPDWYGSRVDYGNPDKHWALHVMRSSGLGMTWQVDSQNYSFADGSMLPPLKKPIYKRAIWKLPVQLAEAQLILERRDDRYVSAELRLTVRSGQTMPKGKLKLVAEGKTLSEFKLDGRGAGSHVGYSSSTGYGQVMSRVVELAPDTVITAQLHDGKRAIASPPLKP